MLNTLIKSIRKSLRLKRFYKALTNGNNHGQDDRLFLEFMDFCKRDENVVYVIGLYEVNDDTLRNLYQLLLKFGAGQFAGGHYVAAASFAYAHSLYFVLDSYDGDDFFIKDYDSRNSGLYVANRLIKYFENGETGPIKE